MFGSRHHDGGLKDCSIVPKGPRDGREDGPSPSVDLLFLVNEGIILDKVHPHEVLSIK